MKKTAAVLACSVILIAGVFAGCNGNNNGNVSDTSQDLGGAMTEMATDISDMFDGTLEDDGTGTATVTATEESTTV